jgi:hypothetical protein
VRTFQAVGVHDGADVVHAFGGAAEPEISPREAGSAFVEGEDASEPSKSVEQRGEGRHLPAQIQMRDESRHVDDVYGAGTEARVRDVDHAAPCVTDRRRIHALMMLRAEVVW